MKISFVVMAHQRRRHWFDILRDELGDVPFAIDSDTLNLGTWGNCKQAWQLIDPKADYGFVIQDDAILCRNFKQKVHTFVEEHNGHPIQLYFGNRESTLKYTRSNEHYFGDHIIAPLQWGLAIGLPQKHIQPMIKFGDELPSHLQDDTRIKTYTRHMGLDAHYPYPSLVDHRPGQTIVGRYNKKNRTAHYFIDNQTPNRNKT